MMLPAAERGVIQRHMVSENFIQTSHGWLLSAPAYVISAFVASSLGRRPDSAV
jgi:hypothetical protein